MTCFCDTLNPQTDNQDRLSHGKSEHAAPGWMRILSGCSQSDRATSEYKINPKAPHRKVQRVRWIKDGIVLEFESILALAAFLGLEPNTVSKGITMQRPVHGGWVERI